KAYRRTERCCATRSPARYDRMRVRRPVRNPALLLEPHVRARCRHRRPGATPVRASDIRVIHSEPWTFLVGRDGRIKAKFGGSVSVRELVHAIQGRPALGLQTACLLAAEIRFS